MRIAQILLATALIAPGLCTHAERITRTEIARGVTLVQTTLGADEPGGPQMVHMLLVKPGVPGVHLESALGGGTVEEPGGGMEAVTRTVLSSGALAGVNADFFPFTGDPLGLDVHQGHLISEPSAGRAAVGFLSNGSVVMGRPHWEGSVQSPDGSTFPLGGLNRKFGQGELVLIAPVYGAATPDAPATIVSLDTEAQIHVGTPLKARVASVSDEKGAVPTRKGGYLLAGTNSAAEWLKAHVTVGATLIIRGGLSDPGVPWTLVREAVAGGPLLLRDGRDAMRLDEEHITADFSTTRHPRTAVGVMKDGTVMLVAVDGRQMLSRGMSLPELADWMKAHGAFSAINLDGGGSTCLSVNGLAINSPSDGIVRRVANSLLVFVPRPVQKVPKPRLHKAVALTAGAPGVAAPKPRLRGPSVWGTVNGGGFADQNGVLYGYRGGSAVAVQQALDGSAEYQWPLTIAAGQAGKMLVAWKNAALQVTIRDVNNNAVAGQEIGIDLPDGRHAEVTTDKTGVAVVPTSLVPTETTPVTLVSGVLMRKWPDTGK